MLDGPSAPPSFSVPISCLPDLLAHHAQRIPDAPAILGLERAPLTYRRLYQQIDAVGRTLRAMGVGRHDRIAVVLPNGPELAVTILAVASNAVCAPLNPAYGLEELERHFVDLHPQAVITLAGSDSPARRAARARDILVIELSIAVDAAAGLFTLAGDRRTAPSDEPASASDPAVLLPTSGTTARPKIVPQTHANICTSAYAHVATFALKESDRCLNVLPLFHGHGLHATLMSSLAAGASIVCIPGLDASRFPGWLTAFQPTWYTAVPTVHQAILAQARHTRERLADSRLRFIRSSSASLPPSISAELERVFESPVIEWYGMTEVTSAPIACNPMPPGQRRAGSVGKRAALDVAIMDEAGALSRGDQTGEVVVCGPTVTSGYDGNPSATAAAFAGDWFRTGDLGYFNDAGYLFLVGRIREMINRGGEKVAPQEVDQVLLDHPAVAEAVTFAVPHPTLSEDVASAIVLRPNAAATPREIRQFAIGRIADFKIPRQVLIVEAIPKGSTGKVQRVGLAAGLGLTNGGATPKSFVAPRTSLEKALSEHWAKILQIERVGIHDDFFALGGDSLLAIRVLAHVYDVTQVELDVARLFETPTVAEIADHLQMRMHADQRPRPSLAIAPASREDGVPASLVQEHIWTLQQALHGLPYFNILYALRLTSAVDVAILGRSINEIVRRHEILRTTFAVVDGRHMQVIAPQLTIAPVFDDLGAVPEDKRAAVGHHLIQQEVLHTFDLAQGPLFRARLVRFAEREHLLLITTHHAIGDGWSFGVLVGELAALYDAFSSGQASPLVPSPIQYADFAYWQRGWRSHPDIVAQLQYWREQLRDPLPAMRLASARPTRISDSFRTARRQWALPQRLAEAARRFSHDSGGTLFMTLVAALKTLLHRYLDQDDLLVATNVANRNRPGTGGLIGPLANTIILRTNLGGDPSPREVMRRVRATTVAAFAHQDIPFEELAEILQRERGLDPAGLAPVMFMLHNASLRPLTSSGHGLAFEEAEPSALLPLLTTTTLDVSMMLRETAHGLVGTCVYKPYLSETATIDRLLRDYHEVLEQMVTRPEQPISAIRVTDPTALHP
jgi:acyl-CoA synthetase (AMP-forming)/AMP-acid ligase II